MSDSLPPKLPPELFLRIQCPRCLQFQAVSLADKPKTRPECHHCGGIIPLPRLNRQVRGMEVILKAYPGPELVKMRLPCPGCAAFLTVSPEVAGQRRRCPECAVWFRLDLMQEGVPHSPGQTPAETQAFTTANPETTRAGFSNPSTTDNSPEMPGAIFMEIDEESGPSQSPKQHMDDEERSALTGYRLQQQPPHRPPPPPPVARDWEDDVPDEEDRLPLLVEKNETRYQPHLSDHSNVRVLPFRLISRCIFWATWIVLPLIFLLIAGAFKSFGFVLLGLILFAFPMPIANFIMSLLFRQIRCPGCHRVHSAVSRWSCGCGYNSPYEVNIFQHRCPLCRSYSGHYDCPHCESTILVR